MSDFNLDALINESALYGELTNGADPVWLAAQHGAAAVAVLGNATTVTNATPGRVQWTDAEEAFVRANYLTLSDAELAAALGRSANGIHIRRERFLRIPARSRREQWLCGRDVAIILGMGCAKTAGRLIDRGLLKGHVLPLDAKIYAVSRHDLTRFALNPRNWVYFHPDRVTDPTLARQIALRRARWDDEWWSVGQVAAYHGCAVTTVSHFVAKGVIPATRWGNSWILRSDATRVPIVSGRGHNNSIWTPGADAAAIYARGAGLSLGEIVRLIGHGSPDVRLKYLWDKELLLDRVHAHRLGESGLHIDPVHRLLYVPYPHARGRYPFLDRAVDRFRAGQPLAHPQARAVLGVMAVWAQWHAKTPELQALAKRLEARASIAPASLAAAYAELQAHGFTL